MTSEHAEEGRDENMSKRKIRTVIIYLILMAATVFVLVPIIWLIITSFKPRGEIYMPSMPSKWVLDSYSELLQNFSFDKYFKNSLIVASVTTVLVCIVSIPAAYGFANYRYCGSRKIFTGCVFLRMFPFITLLIPLYIYISKLGLMNTKLALVIANTTFNLPMSLWIMEACFRGLPNELIDAASIDGASRIKTFLQVMLPVSKPSIATIVILTFLNAWNEFMFAFICTSSENAKTITVGMTMLTQEKGIRWDLMAAAGSLYIIPMLVIVIIFQKAIVRGMTLGSVKG